MERNRNTTSIWDDTSEHVSFPSLNADITVDVVVIGGGITGITAAHLLSKAGKRVAVVEAHSIGKGTTGYSTGNLYAPVGERLYHIESKFDKETLQQVTDSRTAAIDFIERRIWEYHIDCEFMRVPWYLFTEADEDEHQIIEKETNAILKSGLSHTITAPASFPMQYKKIVKVENQAQFNPLKYIQGLAAKTASLGCLIFENSKMTQLDRGTVCTVHTDKGKITASKVIMATHTPKGIYGVHTAMGPYREYAMAVKLNTPYPANGTYWMVKQGKHYSIRPYTNKNGSFLIVLGEKHKVGHKEHNEENFLKLEAFIRARFDVDRILYTWAAQNYKPADNLPYIGPDGADSNVYIATGFAADGLVYGTLGAMIITDQIQGIPNNWSKIYDANRFTPAASFTKFVKENVDVAKDLIVDYATFGQVKELEEILPGEGKTINLDGQKLAAYCDHAGKMHVVSAICPHMGCVVHWNNVETSWDCPCHGSRFHYNGELIEGPSIDGLSIKAKNKNS